MKKWTRPVVLEEQFTANSNVSVCYSLVCTLPGKDPYTEDGSSYSFITESKVKDRGSIHSIWGEQSFRWEEKHNNNCSLPARYNEDTGVFKESGGNAAQVSNIKIDKANPAADGRYPAIWTSNYIGLDYHHMGYAVDDSVAHPLRS